MELSDWAEKVKQTTAAPEEHAPRKKRGRPAKKDESLGGISPVLAAAASPTKGSESIFEEWNLELLEALSETPEPFIEPEEKPYTTDFVDSILPRPGFITDFVNTGRGMESPSLFFVWNALWLLSTILKREAWLKWYPGKLWPNLYVLIVAPPSLCRKSSSMIIANNLLRSLPYFLPSTLESYKKETKIITGKTTPEGLLMSLAPEERLYFTEGSDTEAAKMKTVKKGSQIALNVSEFAVFLGKQQYNTGMVTLLTDLFDCKDYDGEVTRGRGDKPLEDIYVTLFGAITPDGLKMSIPDEAFGGGFMSRMILAYQHIPTKIYDMPEALAGYPVWEDLRLKLAWISRNAIGEYELTPEARAFYKAWYHEWKAELFSKGSERQEENRIDSLILRVALLMRVQEYRPGTDITVENIMDAHRLITYTVTTSKHATEDVGGTFYSIHMNAIKRVLQRRGTVTRRELSQFMSSRGASAKEISDIVEQLSVEGYLRIMISGQVIDRSTGVGKEEYQLLGERD